MGEIDEAELLSAGQRGAVLDGMADDRKRIVQAAVLRRCCHELKDRIDPRGLRLTNAIVTGELDLTGLVVPFPLRFEGCEFDTAPVVEGAQLFELSLTGSPCLPGLLGNGLRVQRDLDLSRSHIAGAHWTSASTTKRSAVWLCEAEIGGRLLCVDTLIDGHGDRSLQADRIHVGGAIRLLREFQSRGEIRLIGARISGTLDLSGAHIVAPGGPALNLEDAVLEGSMFLIESSAERRPEIRGGVAMGSVRIAGRLLVRNAIIEPPADAPRFSTRGRLLLLLIGPGPARRPLALRSGWGCRKRWRPDGRGPRRGDGRQRVGRAKRSSKCALTRPRSATTSIRGKGSGALDGQTAPRCGPIGAGIRASGAHACPVFALRPGNGLLF